MPVGGKFTEQQTYPSWYKQILSRLRPTIPTLTPQAAETYRKWFGEVPKSAAPKKTATLSTSNKQSELVKQYQEAKALADKVAQQQQEQTSQPIFGAPVRYQKKVLDDGSYYYEQYDASGNLVGISDVTPPQTISPYQKEQIRLEEESRQQTQQPTKYEPYGADPYGGMGSFNPYRGQWEAPPGWISPYEQAQLDLARQQEDARISWYREQAAMQQAETERQYKANLAANPMSWLQYSAYTGETPVVQKWMEPLSGGYTAGQSLPGWSGGGGSSLTELTRPSAQYLARIGPTALQQYYGYEQSRTGATPEETAFRLGSTGAPSGRNRPLRWMR